MNQTFQTKKTITFREADPAGIMFFANIFDFAHDAYEAFIEGLGYKHSEWFGSQDIIIPIRQTEATFNAPLLPGETYQINTSVSKIGETSFQLKYVFTKNSKTHATVSMVHAVADKKTMQKRPIPENLKQQLLPYLENLIENK